MNIFQMLKKILLFPKHNYFMKFNSYKSQFPSKCLNLVSYCSELCETYIYIGTEEFCPKDICLYMSVIKTRLGSESKFS